MGGFDRRALLAGAAALAIPVRLRAAAASSVVRTRAGPVRGTIEDGLHVFRGLRYGQDTRPRRFLAPLAPTPWAEPADATDFAPSCPQKGGRIGPTSEDCLFLNVWTPGPNPAARRPVMVYIHGGAYSTGSVVTPLNDGRHLAAQGDVVVVTINHRLNALGYLYLARLDPRFPDSGNAGQLDLILALRWVRDNIAAFGGDPGKVMVFGQSGGGAKIATLMGTPAAKGLFHRAVTMSGQQVTASGPLNATARARAYLKKLGLEPSTIDRLRELPTERLIEGLDADDPILASGGVYFGPVLDQRILLRHPFYPDAHPQGLSIPMMLGNMHDETRAFIPENGPTVRGLSWDNLAERIAPELRIDILPEYVVSRYRQLFPNYTPLQVFYSATTAGRSWRGQVIEAEERAKAGAPAFVYQVDFVSQQNPAHGTPHGMDIPLSFGTIDAPGSPSGTGPAARAASGHVMGAYLAFTRSGDPNHPGLPHWPKYDLKTRSTMIFDVAARTVDDPRREERLLFAAVPYIQPGT
ncbi:carboxylesterase/lipase family protein [Sphingomonas crusticola]|uniref:carboxylesterase/lipase family protein n=1 Tax=Sphingomonas crusticola TaxID=1697973 RepID=UPI000E22AEC4|nr:carboxylesterase/lipase family protein [Sphingomonas crusticola]